MSHYVPVVDTPEMQRVRENQKNFSTVSVSPKVLNWSKLCFIYYFCGGHTFYCVWSLSFMYVRFVLLEKIKIERGDQK